MKARTLTGTMEVSKLINDLCSKTVQWSYINEMTDIFIGKLTSGEVMNLPTVETFTERVVPYRKKLLSLYNGTFGIYECVTKIPDVVKIAQAAVLDGLCYGYDLGKGVNNVYTMRVDLFGDELESKDLDKVIEANLKGEIKALKLSYEYRNNDNKIIDYKLGTHRTIIKAFYDEDHPEDLPCLLLPLTSGVCLLELLKKFMEQGLVIKVTQDLANSVKVRCVTEKLEVLRNYCDSPAAVHGMKSIYYPLDAFFYAPVIGAPSTTAMMTNVNLFNISELKRLQNNKQLSELGVQKPSDPISIDLSESIITEYILKVAEDEGSAEFEELLERLPKREILGNVGRNITEREIARYLHVMKRADIKEILKCIPAGEKKLEKRRSIFADEVRLATEEEMQNPYILFKNHVCKVLIKKKDGTFSSMICTNNKDFLSNIYGSNYFKTYESFGVRARAVDNAMCSVVKLSQETAQAILNTYNFDVDASDILEEAERIGGEDKYYDALFSVFEMKKKAPSEGEGILVRNVNGRFSKKKGKAVGYYNSVDMNKVQRILVLG